MTATQAQYDAATAKVTQIINGEIAQAEQADVMVKIFANKIPAGKLAAFAAEVAHGAVDAALAVKP